MRKETGFVLLALVLVIGAVVTPVVTPAGAAPAGTRCTTTSGSATFSPAVPKLNNVKKVVSTVTAKGVKIAGCTGGAVKSGSSALTLKFSKAGNCATLATGVSNPLAGKVAVSWNTAATSIVAKATAVSGPKTPTQWKIAGAITAGPFKGSKLSVSVVYVPANGGCTKRALKTATFKQVTPLVIK